MLSVCTTILFALDIKSLLATFRNRLVAWGAFLSDMMIGTLENNRLANVNIYTGTMKAITRSYPPPQIIYQSTDTYQSNYGNNHLQK